MSQVETCILQLCAMTHFVSLARIFVSNPSSPLLFKLDFPTHNSGIHTPDPASYVVMQRSCSRKPAKHVVSSSGDTFVGTGQTLQDKQNRTPFGMQQCHLICLLANGKSSQAPN